MSEQETTQSTETAEAPVVETQSQSEEQSTEVQNPSTEQEAEASSDDGEKSQAEDSQDSPQADNPPAAKVPKEFGSKEEWLHDLIRRGEENPAVVYDETPGGELDILQEYYDGKLKPKAPAKKDEEDSTEKDDSTEEEKKTPKEEKTEKEESEKAEKKEEPPLSSLDNQIMKELGAKSKSEILEKIKGFRKAISGKLELAPEYQQIQKDNAILKQRMQNEIKLWEDYRAGRPEAVEFVKKNYIPDGTPKPQLKEGTARKETSDGRLRIDESELIDERGAQHINKVIDTLYDQLEEQRRITSELMSDKTKHSETMAHQTAEQKVVDEMVLVAEQLPHLQKVANIRQAIEKWRNGADDPRMEYFNDLFEIANKHNVDLPTAADIDRGRNSTLAIKRAASEAKKEVYDRKPNRSLSEVQGKQGEFKQFSDSEIQDMVYGKIPMPDSWFDENDNPVPSRIPKRAHRFFGIRT